MGSIPIGDTNLKLKIMEDQLKPYLTESGIFIPIINKTLSLKNSLRGSQVYYSDCYKVPSFKEWLIILYFLDDVNDIITANNGDPLSGVYWTSKNDNQDPYFRGHGICIYGKDDDRLLGFTGTYVAKVRIFVD